MPALKRVTPRGSLRAGMTLIETMIGISVLSIVMGSIVLSMKQGTGAWATSMEANSLDTKTERTLDRIVGMLEVCSAASLEPSLDPNNVVIIDNLSFQEMIGYANRAPVLGPARNLSLELAPGELANGVDDNGNGLVDEQRLMLNEVVDGNARSIAMASGISQLLAGEVPNGEDDNGNGLIDEPGLCFDATGGTLNIRLSMEQVSSTGQLLVRTLETALTLN